MKTRHPKAKAQTQAPAKEEKHSHLNSHRNWKKKNAKQHYCLANQKTREKI